MIPINPIKALIHPATSQEILAVLPDFIFTVCGLIIVYFQMECRYHIVEKAQIAAEWEAALAKGWIKPADMGGKKHDKQCEVCSSLCLCSAPALALLPALLALPDSLAPRCWSRPSALRAPIAPTSSSSTRARSLPTPCRNGLMSLRPRRIWSTRALRAPRGPLWSRTSSSTSGERTTRRRSKIFTQS